MSTNDKPEQNEDTGSDGSPKAKRKYSKYSDIEKAAILTVYDACGQNLHETARRTGVHPGTLWEWVQGRVTPAITAMREGGREVLAQRFEEIALKAIGLIPEKMDKANARDLTWIAGVSTDKMLLLRNQPTQITEERLSEDQAQERIALLLEQARKRKEQAGEAGEPSE